MRLVLHSYPLSPFANKVKRVLAHKRLDWHDASVPKMPPRAALDLLTGGNRRIPVLQIGADILCDSNLILRFLEAIEPRPSIYPPGSEALSYALSHWYEPLMFKFVTPLRFQGLADIEGRFESQEEAVAFSRDRAPFMAPLLDTSQVAAQRDWALSQMKEFVAFLADELARTGPFLCGEEPSHADFSASHPLLWLRRAPDRLSEIPGADSLQAWLDRMSALERAATGQVTPADALQHAKEAEPHPGLLPVDARPVETPPTRVAIAPSDYGTVASEGLLVREGRDYWAIEREIPEAGRVRVHFPQWGYSLTALAR